MQRRDFLRTTVAGGLGLSTLAHQTLAQMPRIEPARANPGFQPDVELALTAQRGDWAVLPGAQTSLWHFTGQVMKGDASVLSFADGSGHLPVLRLRRGQKVRIHFDNRLPEASIVHWHGLNIPQRMDGHPMYAIEPGERYVYEFEIVNRAGTYWFHPHPHERTSFQVYQGLSGLLLVTDDEEAQANLPAGEQDVPLVIQDRSFDEHNQLRYIGNMRHDWMMGFSGERVLVNGHPQYSRQVSRTAHRIRLFNGSNATLYHLRWSHGQPFTVIGTDGGLLEQARQQESLTLGIGERVDVWVDFSGQAAGSSVHLLAESYTPSLENFTETQQGEALQDGARPIAGFVMSNAPATEVAAPGRLSVYPALSAADAVNAGAPRRVQISMRMGSFYLNNRVFGGMQDVADDSVVKLGSTEVWEFANDARMGMGMGMGMGGMMQMAHPMHVHNVQFTVQSRIPADQSSALHRRLSAGFTDYGLKDVVVVLPGERVQVLMKFENHTGLYLYHCHILEHEDLGMMQNYRVEA